MNENFSFLPHMLSNLRFDIGLGLQGRSLSWEAAVRSLARLSSQDRIPCLPGADVGAVKEACIQDFSKKLQDKEETWKLSELLDSLTSMLPCLANAVCATSAVWRFLLTSWYSPLQSPNRPAHRRILLNQSLPAEQLVRHSSSFSDCCTSGILHPVEASAAS